MKHRWTEEQREYIREIAPGKYNAEIAKLFNTKFGTDLVESQIKNFKANHGIKSNVQRKRRTKPKRLFTQEQENFIAANVEGLSNQQLTDLVNKRFDLSVKVKQIKAWKKNHGYSSGLRGSEGTPPPNKGTKGVYNVGGNRTSFKSGHRPKNYKPVGSERVNIEGYIEIKVADPNVWSLKHRVVWEEAYGPIPRGHVVLFADQNRQNVDLVNLILLPQRKLSTLNQKGLISNNADLTRTGIIIADIYQKISERKKKK